MYGRPWRAGPSVGARAGRRGAIQSSMDGISVGMAVVDADGKRLGKVSACDRWGFEVRRGFWMPREWVILYDEVLGVDDGTVRVARSDQSLFELAGGGLPHAWAGVRSPEVEQPLPATPAEARKFAGVANVRSPGAAGPPHPEGDSR